MAEVLELFLPDAERQAAREKAKTLRSWDLSDRQLCDLELMMTGAFAPLSGFLTRADYERVCADMRLADGTLWPMPVTLDVSEAFAAETEAGQTIALRDGEGVLIALLDVEDVWAPDLAAEAMREHLKDVFD